MSKHVEICRNISKYVEHDTNVNFLERLYYGKNIEVSSITLDEKKRKIYIKILYIIYLETQYVPISKSIAIKKN